jgi:hypothetical protein
MERIGYDFIGCIVLAFVCRMRKIMKISDMIVAGLLSEMNPALQIVKHECCPLDLGVHSV